MSNKRIELNASDLTKVAGGVTKHMDSDGTFYCKANSDTVYGYKIVDMDTYTSITHMTPDFANYTPETWDAHLMELLGNSKCIEACDPKTF